MLIIHNKFNDEKKAIANTIKMIVSRKMQCAFTHKILNLFLNDLNHQIQQKNFFFIKKILLKIFNEFNAMTIR